MSIERLCLGTAGLGMPWYGLGSTSRPSHRDSAAILRAAYAGGIRCFDTARAYGDAEDLLREYLPETLGVTVTTKTAPDLWAQVHNNDDVFGDYLLLHNPSEEEMQVGSGWVDGASVYTPDEARAVIARCGRRGFRHLQVPYCVLDQRHAAIIPAAQVAGVTVYARQPFLQGLLTNDVPLPHALRDAGVARQQWVSLCAAAGISRVEAALRFALASGADYVVFGVGSEAHLAEVLDAARRPEPASWPDLLGRLRSTFASAAVELRSLWAPAIT